MASFQCRIQVSRETAEFPQDVMQMMLERVIQNGHHSQPWRSSCCASNRSGAFVEVVMQSSDEVNLKGHSPGILAPDLAYPYRYLSHSAHFTTQPSSFLHAHLQSNSPPTQPHIRSLSSITPTQRLPRHRGDLLGPHYRPQTRHQAFTPTPLKHHGQSMAFPAKQTHASSPHRRRRKIASLQRLFMSQMLVNAALRRGHQFRQRWIW